MRRTVVLVTVALFAGLLPIPSAQAAPAIQLLNPSGYSGAAPEISTKNDVDGSYHFVAWVPTPPPNAIVEFEVQTAAGNSLRTIEARQVGADTFEAFDNLSNLVDGTYQIAALLYSNGQFVNEGVDRQTVTLRNSVGQVESAELIHPSNGGALGFFTPKDLRPRAIVDVRLSEGALQARVLVTSSRPGTEPVWEQCGSGGAADMSARVRCTLPDGMAPSEVTAIAAVANQTPTPGPAQATADDSGDAHRVTPYVAVPTGIFIDPEAIQTEVSECRELSATVTDQLGRPLSAVNVDVHAVGPTDQLQFASGGNAMEFQPPNDGPHSSEAARRCSTIAPERRQGDTQRINAPDEKHIESLITGITNPGTTNNGVFTFSLFSDAIGGTQIIVFADVNDDDVQQPSEASGGARLGWGQEPPAAAKQAFMDPASGSGAVGSCQRFVFMVKEGGNPASGQNADVHISSTDTTPSFCNPGDGTPTRAPDQGDHVAGAHSDGPQHIEGELDFEGRMIFGVTAPSEGRVIVQGWVDESDDDVFTSGEPTDGATVNFGVDGEREVSLDSNRRRVRKGRRVRLFGAIDGAPSCEGGQTVRLRARPRGGRFKVIARKQTAADGSFTFRPRVRRTTDFQVVAPRNAPCEFARSRPVTVRVRR